MDDPPEKQSAKCPECERLWGVYALATRKYLHATLAEEASAGSSDTGQMNVPKDEALEAAQWRELARKAIRDHAATHAEKTASS